MDSLVLFHSYILVHSPKYYIQTKDKMLFPFLVVNFVYGTSWIK